MLSIGDSLLAATSYGVFLFNPGVKRIIKNASYFLLRSKKDINRVWVGTLQGLVSLYLENESGQSPIEFIRSYRLKRAAQLLESGLVPSLKWHSRWDFPAGLTSPNVSRKNFTNCLLISKRLNDELRMMKKKDNHSSFITSFILIA